MAYTVHDLNLRIAWITSCYEDKASLYLTQLETGKNCPDLERELCLLKAFQEALCRYDPTESYNHLTEVQIDHIVDQVSELCNICFTGKGLASLS